MVSDSCECRKRTAGNPVGPPARAQGGAATGLGLAQAEEMLDWLEARGYTGLGACLLDDGGVTVYWDGRPRTGC